VSTHSYVETNVVGTLNLLEAARELGVKRFVHTSTSEVYGTALTVPISERHSLQGQSPYSASKIGGDMMAEAFARSFGLPVVILRPFNTFGPRQSERAVIPTIIRQILDPNCLAVHIGDTSPERDLTYVSDIVSAFIAVGEATNIEFGQAYNAGNGKCISIGALLNLIQETIGIKKPIVHDPERVRPSNSEVRVLLADSRKLGDAAEWRPKIPLKNGLALTVDWWRRQMKMAMVRRDHRYMT
jgi:UDP-glucose 4-epimerase